MLQLTPRAEINKIRGPVYKEQQHLAWWSTAHLLEEFREPKKVCTGQRLRAWVTLKEMKHAWYHQTRANHLNLHEPLPTPLAGKFREPYLSQESRERALARIRALHQVPRNRFHLAKESCQRYTTIHPRLFHLTTLLKIVILSKAKVIKNPATSMYLILLHIMDLRRPMIAHTIRDALVWAKSQAATTTCLKLCQ